MLKNICVLLSLLLMPLAGARGNDERRATQQSVQALHGLTVSERIAALTALAANNRPDDLAAFGAIAAVQKIAADKKQNLLVRFRALGTLRQWQKNGISIPDFLPLLNKLIAADSGAAPPLRLAGYVLIVEAIEAAGQESDNRGARDQIFATLSGLWKNKKITDAATKKRQAMSANEQIALVRALGVFGDKPEAQKILLGLINRPGSPAIFDAAVAALTDGMRLYGQGNAKLARTLGGALAKATEPSAQVLILDAISEVASALRRAEKEFAPDSKTQAAALKMLQEGQDGEVLAAVRFLLLVSQKDASVGKELIATVRAATARGLDFYTVNMVNMALVDVLVNAVAPGERGQAPSAANLAVAKEIIAHMLNILKPQNTSRLPQAIKDTAVQALSALPVSLDRREAVKVLIGLLALTAQAQPGAPFIDTLEAALSFLTGQVPFRRVMTTISAEEESATLKPQSNKVPDIAAWQQWYKDNEAKLAPGKSPY